MKSIKIFINLFAFLYVNANSKESVKKYPFYLFFRKMLMTGFLFRVKGTYLKKNARLPTFFAVDFNIVNREEWL